MKTRTAFIERRTGERRRINIPSAEERRSQERRGRPRRVPGERVVRVSLRMSESEWALFRFAARLHGQSQSDYFRVHVLGLAQDDLEHLAPQHHAGPSLFRAS